jgi:hypothetical protein
MIQRLKIWAERRRLILAIEQEADRQAAEAHQWYDGHFRAWQSYIEPIVEERNRRLKVIRDAADERIRGLP